MAAVSAAGFARVERAQRPPLKPRLRALAALGGLLGGGDHGGACGVDAAEGHAGGEGGRPRVGELRRVEALLREVVVLLVVLRRALFAPPQLRSPPAPARANNATDSQRKFEIIVSD